MQQLKRIGDSPDGLTLLDRELGQRISPITITLAGGE